MPDPTTGRYRLAVLLRYESDEDDTDPGYRKAASSPSSSRSYERWFCVELDGSNRVHKVWSTTSWGARVLEDVSADFRDEEGATQWIARC